MDTNLFIRVPGSSHMPADKMIKTIKKKLGKKTIK